MNQNSLGFLCEQQKQQIDKSGKRKLHCNSKITRSAETSKLLSCGDTKPGECEYRYTEVSNYNVKPIKVNMHVVKSTFVS